MNRTITLSFNILMNIFSLIASSIANENADSLATSSSISIVTSESARVFLDGDSIGIAPLTFESKSGIRVLKLVSETNVSSWASEPIVDTISIKPNTPLTLRYEFGKRILLNSSPSEAEVYSRDSLLGTTPLIIRTNLTSFSFRKKGYEEQFVSSNEPSNASVVLTKKWENEAESSIVQEASVGRSPLRLYLAGATTVLAGAASAYFKVKADNSYSNYVRTGDPNQLSETDRFDTAAGVAIAATQISLGLFTYFILSE